MKINDGILALLVLGLCIGTMGCGDDQEPESDGFICEGDCMLRPDCEGNWVREEGVNGRLYQEISVTFRVPDDYDGPLPPDSPAAISLALTNDLAIPPSEPPKALGVMDEDALLIPGETYTYQTPYADRWSDERGLPCGEYLYIMIGVTPHWHWDSLLEWVYITEQKYQVGVDEEIVIEDAEMVLVE